MGAIDVIFASRRSHIRLALAVAIIPTIAFVLHDLVFQLPDNEGEASLGFFITIAGLLCVWGSSGYILARRARGIGSAIVAGVVAGIVSVGILWFTFDLLNNLFPDRMSYEPDRILAFQRSGYATMREYLNHQRGSGPFPLVMGAAAVAGGVGGAIRGLKLPLRETRLRTSPGR